jgi:hypothetical protein
MLDLPPSSRSRVTAPAAADSRIVLSGHSLKLRCAQSHALQLAAGIDKAFEPHSKSHGSSRQVEERQSVVMRRRWLCGQKLQRPGGSELRRLLLAAVIVADGVHLLQQPVEHLRGER